MRIKRQEQARRTMMLLLAAALSTCPALADEASWRFEISEPGRLEIGLGERTVATYLYEHSQLSRPALINVHAPTGRRITRVFPPTDPEDRDHEWIHGGMWLSFGDVSGHDYWRLKARVRHARFLQQPQIRDGQLQFVAENEYLSTGGQEIIGRERASYQFARRDEGIVVAVQYTLTPEDAELVFGDQEENGLGVRMRSELRVRGGSGRLTNSAGDENEPNVWGKPTQWLDYSGILDGRRLGALVMPRPDNPRRSWAHARDYGVMVLNPFDHQPQLDPRPPAARVPPGQQLELAYAVLFYDMPADQPFAPSAVYAEVMGRD